MLSDRKSIVQDQMTNIWVTMSINVKELEIGNFKSFFFLGLFIWEWERVGVEEQEERNFSVLLAEFRDQHGV